MAAANCHVGCGRCVGEYARTRMERFMARHQIDLAAIAALALAAATTRARADDLNDYPTTARAEYVFGCMKANGETPRALEQCSCSVDIIATLLPYERYVSAETVLRMAQVPGILGNQFRSTEKAHTALDDLRRVQAEAEVRCF